MPSSINEGWRSCDSTASAGPKRRPGADRVSSGGRPPLRHDPEASLCSLSSGESLRRLALIAAGTVVDEEILYEDECRPGRSGSSARPRSLASGDVA